jgi:hypothetical protein
VIPWSTHFAGQIFFHPPAKIDLSSSYRYSRLHLHPAEADHLRRLIQRVSGGKQEEQDPMDATHVRSWDERWNRMNNR